MEIRFDNKIVLVTGASRGIGRAVAGQFALSGATIAAHYNSNHEAAKSLLAGLPGKGHSCLPADGNDYMTGCIVDMNGPSYLRS